MLTLECVSRAMRHHFFALPASLLTLLSGSHITVADNSLTADSAARSQFGQEDEHGVHDQERMGWRPPLGVRKMSGDAGEKFFMDYWQASSGLEEDTGEQGIGRRAEPGTLVDIYGNASSLDSFLPPLLLHSDMQTQYPYLRFFHRNVFDKRNFQCPTGTSSCSNIDRPDSCCATGETHHDDAKHGNCGQEQCELKLVNHNHEHKQHEHKQPIDDQDLHHGFHDDNDSRFTVGDNDY
ncbi:hypothetical protein K490DRAFT_58210 [Saccharata proteae CBS 121410]|uniref:Uncharacterized protein n=1 Tax=Saccharata proteae CBS 121410 TaxID=1314787 RepID=A0A9P4HTY7_9PEZI|nr:hypothetical protein K490DRAFT_58210 [Saccharata proteae CBS 121410]